MCQVVPVIAFSGFVSCFSLLPLRVMSLYVQFFFYSASLPRRNLFVITLSMARRLYVIIVMSVLVLLMLLESLEKSHFLYRVLVLLN